MKILIVGGAGYVGSTVASDLLAAGHDVVVFDNLSHGHRQAIPDGSELVVGDTRDPAAVERLFRTYRFDAVMHFAALIEAGESMAQPGRYFSNNVSGTIALLEAMIKSGTDRFVFSSSAAIYGNPSRVPVEEDAPPGPTSPYGESKLVVEQMLPWLRRAHGLRYACLRYFNVAGAASPHRGEDHRPESHLIPIALAVALGRLSGLSIFGTDYATPDGTCVRDYIHVSDVSRAHRLALEALEEKAELHLNLGNGAGFSVKQVVEAARRVTGRPIPAVERPRRPGDPAILVASSERARRELGWQPRFPDLDDIVLSAWEWHRHHPDGYG